MGALTLLPIDLTGIALTNRVTNELHSLISVPGRDVRLLFLNFGGFYEENFVLFNSLNQSLVKNIDYRLGGLHSDLTRLTGKAIYGFVLIINPTVTTQVRVNYRAVGGNFGVSPEEMASIIEQLDEESLGISWNEVINKPKEYPPMEHTHEYWQLYGAEKTIAAMERVEEAIGNDKSNAYQHDINYAEFYYQQSVNFQIDYRALIINHRNRTDNPHIVTKAQLGLGNVENLPLASTPEAQDGTRHDRYMTLQQTYNSVMALGSSQVNSHISNTNNPHGVTAGDVGTYTRAETDSLVDEKLPRNGNSYDATRLQGFELSSLLSSITSGLPATNFIDLLHNEHLSTWLPTPTSIYYEDRWVQPIDVFGPILPPNVKWMYIGQIYTIPRHYLDIRTYLNQVYTSLTIFPYGSIILYSHRYANQRNYGNGVAVTRYVQLEAAVRTASGWVQYN